MLVLLTIPSIVLSSLQSSLNSIFSSVLPVALCVKRTLGSSIGVQMSDELKNKNKFSSTPTSPMVHCVHANLLQSWPALCNPVDRSPLDSSGHGILQTRILQLPRPAPGDRPHPGTKATSLASPALAGRFITTGTTWEDQWSFLSSHISLGRRNCK